MTAEYPLTHSKRLGQRFCCFICIVGISEVRKTTARHTQTFFLLIALWTTQPTPHFIHTQLFHPTTQHSAMESLYHPLTEHDELNAGEKRILDSPFDRHIRIPSHYRRYLQHPYLVWVCHGILLSLSLVFFVSSLVLRANIHSSVGSTLPTFPYCKYPIPNVHCHACF